MSVLKRKLFCGGQYRTLYWSSITQNSLLGQVHLPCRYVCVFHLIASSQHLALMFVYIVSFLHGRQGKVVKGFGSTVAEHICCSLAQPHSTASTWQ